MRLRTFALLLAASFVACPLVAQEVVLSSPLHYRGFDPAMPLLTVQGSGNQTGNITEYRDRTTGAPVTWMDFGGKLNTIQAILSAQWLNKVCMVDENTPGADAGAKIAYCRDRLPATGGTVDARGLEGAQTISQNVFAGASSTKRVHTILGDAAYTFTASQIIPYGSSLVGQGYASNTGAANRAPTVLIKDGNFTGIVVGGAAILENLQVDGAAGNGGDGVQLIGSRNSIRNLAVTSQGGVGVRVGDDTGTNSNLWRAQNVITISNTSHGFFVHDGKNAPPDANAGMLIGLDSRGNGGDGLQIGNAFDNQFFAISTQLNTGVGIRLTGGAGAQLGAHGNSFWMPYTEEVGGNIQIDAGADRNAIWGVRASIANSAYVNNGAQNLLLGRVSESLLFHSFGGLEAQDLRINDDGTISGQWAIRQNSANRDLEIALVATGADANVLFTTDGAGTVRLLTTGVTLGPKTFATLGAPTNGTMYFCSDCTIANPCAGAGTGALAKRLNGVWVCN